MFLYSYVYILIRDLVFRKAVGSPSIELLEEHLEMSLSNLTYRWLFSKQDVWVTFRSYLTSVYDSVSINDKAYWTTFGEITKQGVYLQEGNTFGQSLLQVQISLWIYRCRERKSQMEGHG